MIALIDKGNIIHLPGVQVDSDYFFVMCQEIDTTPAGGQYATESSMAELRLRLPLLLLNSIVFIKEQRLAPDFSRDFMYVHSILVHTIRCPIFIKNEISVKHFFKH